MDARILGRERANNQRARQAVIGSDWSSTRAGDPNGWPAEWRAALDLCLNAWIPVCLAVGTELELVFNERFAQLAGWVDFTRLGSPLKEAWSNSLHEQIQPLIAHAFVTECPILIELMLPRSESQAQLSVSPLHDDLGRPTGLFIVATGAPAQVLEERQALLLHQLLKQSIHIASLAEVYRTSAQLLAALSPPTELIAFYEPDVGGRQLRRAGSLGADAEPGLPETVENPFEEAGAWNAQPITSVAQSPLHANAGPRQMTWLPIQRPGELLGALVLRSAHAPSSTEALFLCALATHVAVALDHVRQRSDASQSDPLYADPRWQPERDFVTSLSQRLRGPLALLLREIDDLLRSDNVSKEASCELRIARRSARRLGRLIDILLDLSRFDGRKLRPHRRATNLASFTKRLCDLFRPAFEQAGIAFSVTCTALPYPASVDREMWEKIVCNLLANALKFTLQGRVRVFQYCYESELVLLVSDTGCGIDQGDLPLVFNASLQALPAQARSSEGARIGLSLVRELVRLHGGTVSVSSRLGHGSDFTVRIPFAPRFLASVEQTLDTSDEGDGCEASDTLEAMWEWSADPSRAESSEPPRVLLAEGDPAERAHLCTLLSQRWKVDVVCDGLAALSSALARPPALVLADVDVVGVDGVSLARRLHEDLRTRGVPVVLLCARSGEQASIEGLGVGALDYVVKPVSPRELMARIEARLGQAHERQLDRAARRAAERESLLKDEVIAVVSHELRNPLAAILGWLQVLRDDGFSTGPIAKAIEVIERNANVQARLLKDLFDASRMIAGRLNMELEVIPSLHTVVAPALESLTPLLQQSQIRVDASLDEQAGPVAIDAHRVQQVVWNLLSNAMKFTPPGGRIQVHCGMREGQVVLQVADSGRGITREFLPHVFERFAQEKPDRAKRGLGLGLAISQYIVRQHAGSITAHSDGEGTGTTMTVSFPIAAVDESGGDAASPSTT